MKHFRLYFCWAHWPGLTLLFFHLFAGSLEMRADETAAAADMGSTAVAEPASVLDAMSVYGRSADLIGEATSSSQGRVGSLELSERPFLRRGELLEVVPGVVVTQHSGGGKANQYFLRGFNLDHGTDFSISVDDMPVNMRTHAHGQGYADINFIIPETVRQVNYEKGPFFAQLGDFSAAGAAQYQLVDTLPLGFVTAEIGEHNYARLAAGSSFKTADAVYTAAVESTYDDGPFTLAEHFQRYSGMLKRHWEKNGSPFDLTALAYYAKWRSTDQVPERAVDEGLIGRFGNLDPTDGGATQRDSLSFSWTNTQGDSNTHLTAYAIYYALNLFSDFTFYLNDPVHGDQFNQSDKRLVWGATIDHDWQKQIAQAQTKTTVGLQFRDDIATVRLDNTEKRKYLSSVRDDHVHESSLGAFAKSEVRWTSWFRSDFGLRGDLYRFDVTNNQPQNTGERTAGLLSPKLGLVLGPWMHTEFYFNAGEGFHSNDARGVTTHLDPLTKTPSDPVTPLARIKSVEVGLRTSVVTGLVSTVSVFLMDSSSELILSGDDGSISPTGATRRYGVEFANFYRVAKWLSFDADASFTHARYREESNGGLRIPNSIGTVLTGGATVNLANGWNGSLRLRYFGPQPLIEDNTEQESSSTACNGRIGYKYHNWEFAIEVLNIFDRKNNDIEYYYASRLPGEPADGMNDIHFHPMEPREFRFTVTQKF